MNSSSYTNQFRVLETKKLLKGMQFENSYLSSS